MQRAQAQGCKGKLKRFGSWSKVGQAGPWRENEAGQKVQQPNGDVMCCEWGKARNRQKSEERGKKERGQRWYSP